MGGPPFLLIIRLFDVKWRHDFRVRLRLFQLRRAVLHGFGV